ncbi:bifunctional phosphopantothenoylcysteine decarboxylase/phosphopantothenate--cysteine ligase CoaBC [Flavobacteriales bacterium]|nr:bifunctional phosphopantothenoylcysteine decarboxylase/phosphopantothenate--cysteine ligase CoaBC [Flavobacteriales bacterium]
MKSSSNSILFGKKILIGISGSIAAYKIPELIRFFIKSGAEVKVVLTKSAADFVSPLTLSTVSCNEVIIDFFDPTKTKWNNHVDLALWPDLFLISPASANTISKMANGICDNILLATFLSSKSAIFCAPSMDRDMYLNKSTAHNLKTIKSRGVNVLDVETGELASGLFGQGRMQDINKIFLKIEDYFLQSSPLFGKKILITAGPTYEKIDPVRFIGNFSSGKMGCELAKQGASKGAEIDLVIGPSDQTVLHPRINRIDIQSADEMFKICNEKFKNADIAIFSAAVCDFKPLNYHTEKIKDKSIIIKTQKNKDILNILASEKDRQFVVGFALESNNEEANAIKKLKFKNMDLIVLNSLNDNMSCFQHDTNKVKIIDSDLDIKTYPLMTKECVAVEVFNQILVNHTFVKLFNSNS